LIATLDALAKLYMIPIKYFKTSTTIPFFLEQKFNQTSAKPTLVDFD
jgi:uncharacterized sodium:solute symporter family permease YidK